MPIGHILNFKVPDGLYMIFNFFFLIFNFSFPQKVAERPSAYAIQGNTGGYVYLQQQQYTPPPSQQQIVYQHQICPQQQMYAGQQMQTLHKKGSVRNGGDVLKRTRTQNG